MCINIFSVSDLLTVFYFFRTFSLTGVLYDATLHYPSSFYLGGGVAILGAVIMVPAALGFSKTIRSQSGQSKEDIFKA